MNKKIIIGSLMVVFTLLMLPSMSALELNAVKEANKTSLMEKIEGIKERIVVSKNIRKIMQSLFLFEHLHGILGKLIGILAIPIVIAFLTVFGVALKASIGIAFPLIGALAGIIHMLYGSVFGLTIYTLKALLIVAILILF